MVLMNSIIQLITGEIEVNEIILKTMRIETFEMTFQYLILVLVNLTCLEMTTNSMFNAWMLRFCQDSK